MSARTGAIAYVAAMASVCALLFRFPPTQYPFYPECPIRTLVGIQCPGCGSTRALAALLHGHLAEALRYNALFVLLLPFTLAYALETLRRALMSAEFRWPEPPKAALYGICAITAIFTVLRNLM